MAPQRQTTDLYGRREILIGAGTAAAGGAAALMVASSGDVKKRKPRARPQTTTDAERDVALLNRLIDFEHRIAAAYAVMSRTLDARRARLARSIAIQERQHSAALERAVVYLGTTPAPVAQFGDYELEVPAVRRLADVLSLLVGLEQQAVGTYTDALVQVSTEEVRVTVAAILTNEAEHLAFAAGGLRRPQLTGAFVTATSQRRRA